MKRLLLSIALLLVAVSGYSAQREGEIVAGGRMSLYTRWDGTFGIGAYARYGITDQLRVEPSIMALCRRGMSIDISADFHYAFELDDKYELYPLVGISVNDPGEFGVGFNIGGGTNIVVTEDWDFSGGIKWMIDTHARNPLIISIGAHYKF